MKHLKILYYILHLFGVDIVKTFRATKGLFFYIIDFYKFLSQYKSEKAYKSNIAFFKLGKPYPCLEDKYSNSGNSSGHYFHQDLLVANRIFLNNPQKHVDVGSRIDGFVAHVASFRKIEVFDIRPQKKAIENIHFVQADLTGEINDKYIDYCDSLSCLHALEHFGLGRYGDSVNIKGYNDGFENLYKILKKSGKFYFSLPIGPQRIEFNAHRVFSINYLIEWFSDKFIIDSFSFVDDNGDMHKNISINASSAKNNFGCYYGCGIFEMTKI